ncbi:MAG: YlbF/YmcA family competence regulator [Planctomycetota bacterium]|jgi:cell fate (sporulation/competence/biofilm development) regulator YlbF (YheA/YmcA/DUF963 family)
MEEILAIAERLAEAIGKSDKFIALRDAEQAVRGDEEANGLLENFNKTTISILQKEQNLQPIEPEEKMELANLKENVAANSLLQDLNKAQADYSEMMDKVNRAIFAKLETR